MAKTLPSSLIAIMLLIFAHVSPSIAREQIGVAYGGLERQKMDIFFPSNVTPTTPILFFIYGGSWYSGDRDIYSFVAKTFTKRGYITVIPDYRLYPEVIFPSFVEDATLAFAQVKQKFGNERPIFVSGHSAGAHIGSLITLDERYLAKFDLQACSAMNGFIGLAGPYDFEVTVEKYKKIFPIATRPDSQTINFVKGKAPPVLLLHGETDTLVPVDDSQVLGRRLNAVGNIADVKTYPLVGHMNIVGALAPLMGALAPTENDMLEFMKRNLNRAGC